MLTGALRSDTRDRPPPRRATATASGRSRSRSPTSTTPTPRRVARGARGVVEPGDRRRRARQRAHGERSPPTATPCTPSSTAPATTGRSCPASRRAESPPARTSEHAARRSTTSSATSSSAAWRSGSRFYERVFGMVEMIHFSDEAISTEYSALMSKVVAAATGGSSSRSTSRPRASASRRSTSTSSSTRAPGAQHIAVATPRHRRHGRRAAPSAGSSFLPIPDAYYDEVPERVPEVAGQLADLREQGILVDHDDEGYLLQIFTQADRRPADRLLRGDRAPRRHAASARATSRPCSRRSSASRTSGGTSDERYARSLGELPAKRHVQFRAERHAAGRGGDGLRGLLAATSRSSTTSSRPAGCRGRRVQADRARRVGAGHPRPPAHRHQPGRARRRLARRAAGCCSGTATSRSRSASRPRSATASTATARATRSSSSTRAPAPSRRSSATFRTAPHDYVVIPRGTTYRVAHRRRPTQIWLCFHTPGEIETPNRYRNRYGQLLEHAPFSQRDFHPPAELQTHRDRGEHELTVRVRDGHQPYVLDYHPFDVVGWDGYVYPYTFNIDDFEPITGRIHMPPPVHQTFQGQNFVICSFCPRELDYDPRGDRAALPPLERPVRGGDLLRRRPVRHPQGRRRRDDHAAPVAACRTARSPASSRRRSARGAPRSWR